MLSPLRHGEFYDPLLYAPKNTSTMSPLRHGEFYDPLLYARKNTSTMSPLQHVVFYDPPLYVPKYKSTLSPLQHVELYDPLLYAPKNTSTLSPLQHGELYDPLLCICSQVQVYAESTTTGRVLWPTTVCSKVQILYAESTPARRVLRHTTVCSNSWHYKTRPMRTINKMKTKCSLLKYLPHPSMHVFRCVHMFLYMKYNYDGKYGSIYAKLKCVADEHPHAHYSSLVVSPSFIIGNIGVAYIGGQRQGLMKSTAHNKLWNNKLIIIFRRKIFPD